MDKIYSGIYIDFDRNRLLSTVNVKQFEDRGRWIRIHLLKNGEPMELLGNETLSLSASVDNIVTAFEYSKPGFFTTFTTPGNKNKIEFPVASFLTEIAGREHCELKIVSTSGSDVKTAYTATFDLLVEKSVATSESEKVLKTTDLAKVLQDHEDRITALEESGGGGGQIATALVYSNAIYDNTLLEKVEE